MKFIHNKLLDVVLEKIENLAYLDEDEKAELRNLIIQCEAVGFALGQYSAKSKK